MGLFSTVQTLLSGPKNSGLRQDVILRSADSSGALAAAVISDALGLSLPVSVGEALAVPGVSRGIDLYSAATAQMILTASVPSEDTAWLNHTDGVLSPTLRNVDMVTDLIFHRWTALAVARNAAGHVVNAVHIPKHMWTLDESGAVVYDGRLASPDEVVLIPSLKRLGFLEYAQDSIRQYRDMCRTISNRAKYPMPLLVVREKDGAIATDEEIEAAMEEFAAARESPTGGTVFAPSNIDLEVLGMGADDAAMLIQARNAIRLDFGNFLNLPASLLEGNAGTSDQYSNTLQDANEFLVLSLALYTRAIEARLSQDDVTPEGVTVTFDASVFDTFTPAAGNIGTATAPGTETA